MQNGKMIAYLHILRGGLWFMNIDFNEMLKHYKPVILCVDNTTYEAIDKIAKASFTTRQKIVYTLIQTAMMYNFTPSLEYICCKTQNIPFSKRPKQNRNKAIKIYINNKYLPTLSAIQHNIGEKSIPTTIRYLVLVALEYDYNHKLMFSKPTPLDLSNYNPIGKNNISDFILLDFI